MNPNLKWKVVFIALVILGCIYGLVGLPTFPTSVAQLKDNFAHQIKLGLDLQGGTHLVLQVQTQEAMAQETDQMVERVSTWLRSKNISYDEVRRVDDTHILVRNVDSARLPEFRDYVNAQFANFWDMSPTAGDPSSYTLTLRGAAIAQIQENTMTQSLETIERRINALGLTEPTIQLRGGQNSNEILVQLPGEGDPSRAKEVIQAGGQLELKLVEDPVIYTSETDALSKHSGVLPAGTELVPGRAATRATPGAPSDGEGWYILTRSAVVTGRDLRSATENRNTNNPGQWVVDFTLSGEAARRFGPFTQQNLGRQMAIVLDHRVYSAPTINGRIDDSGMIEGNFSQDSAHDLATGAARRSASGIHQVSRRTHCRTITRSRFHSPRGASFRSELAGGDDLHAVLLPAFGRQCRARSYSEPGHPAGGIGLFRRRAYFAGYCRRDSDHRYGRRFQRSGLRAYSRGIAQWQVSGFRGRSGLRQGFSDHH